MSDNQEKENPEEESEEKESMAVPVDGVAKPQDQPAMKESVAVQIIFSAAVEAFYNPPPDEAFYNPRRAPGLSVQRRAAKKVTPNLSPESQSILWEETAIPRKRGKAFRGFRFGLESPEFPSIFTSPVEALHGAESPAYPLSSVNSSRAAESTARPLRTPVEQPYPVPFRGAESPACPLRTPKEAYRPLLRTKAVVPPRSSKATIGGAISYAGYAAAGKTCDTRLACEPKTSRPGVKSRI
jgi:hypothetical protein